jgi:hypothetical protein
MITSGDAGFVFIHLPVPHPAGFYNRRTRALGVPGSYIDNLVLTDQALHELTLDIAATHLADKTVLVVSSDHSWRVPMWRPEFDWSREDEAAARGDRFDSRPVVMVRFPGEQSGAQISTPFPLVRLHAMLQAMITGQIADPQQLETWAAQQ